MRFQDPILDDECQMAREFITLWREEGIPEEKIAAEVERQGWEWFYDAPIYCQICGKDTGNKIVRINLDSPNWVPREQTKLPEFMEEEQELPEELSGEEEEAIHYCEHCHPP